MVLVAYRHWDFSQDLRTGSGKETYAMASKRQISATKFVRDLRSGMTLSELMDKYSLAPRELDGILRQLKQTLANPSHLYGRSPSVRSGIGIEGIRFRRRHSVGLPVSVHDLADPGIPGQLQDISERGLGIQGIEAKPDEIRTFVVWSHEFFAINQFRLVAKCRWTTPTRDERKCLSGFEIISVPKECLEQFNRFVEACARAERISQIAPGQDHAALPASKVTKAKTLWTCPFCQMPQEKEYEECPQCGIIAKKYMQRLDATKSAILGIMEKEPSLKEVPAADQKDRTSAKTISISPKLWDQLVSLGGDPFEHLTKALSEYVVRHKVGRYGLRD
jgi:hypothetical protein